MEGAAGPRTVWLETLAISVSHSKLQALPALRGLHLSCLEASQCLSVPAAVWPSSLPKQDTVPLVQPLQERLPPFKDFVSPLLSSSLELQFFSLLPLVL